MSEKADLLNNTKEYLKEAKESKEKGSYNTAITLFFKAIAVLIDLFILEKEGFIPSNHNERFRLLESKHPFLYKILDKDFPVYQNSYRTKLTKSHAEVLENDFKQTVKYTGIKID